MQSKHTLEVVRRERVGSRYARREREAGRLPAVLYGHGKDPVALSLDATEALRFFHSGERVFTIEVKGEGASQTVLLKEVQFDYLGTNPVHVDLTRVDLNEVIESAVAVHLRGEPVGLKTAGAIMMQPTMSLEVRCTVANLPEHIDVDVSKLDVGGALHAGELTLPQGIELVSDPEAVVATISIKKAVDETAGTEGEAVGAEAAEPEVISERKQAEGKEEEGS